jgi:hypothetical protein
MSFFFYLKSWADNYFKGKSKKEYALRSDAGQKNELMKITKKKDLIVNLE